MKPHLCWWKAAWYAYLTYAPVIPDTLHDSR